MGVVGVELGEVDPQVLDRLAGDWHGAGLVPFAGQGDVSGWGQAKVVQGQVGDLRFPPECGGIHNED